MPGKDYYVVLHGARKNVGDFLIRQRSVELFNNIRPDRELVQFPHWEPLDDKLDIVNNSKALVIMGSPGVQEHAYPGVYPVTKNLDDIKVPIVLLGVGAYLFPFNERNMTSFRFSKKSIGFFKKCDLISVRDAFTKRLLNINGFEHVEMLGCPAWYYYDYLNKPVSLPKEIKKIVFSVPQKKYFYKQFLSILDAVKEHFPNAQLKVIFNRGFVKDKLTTEDSAALYNCKLEIEKRGIEIDDFAYSVEKFITIEDFDIHIGYRLHTQIFFCSIRKPTYVVAEDCRSWSNYHTLSLPGFSGIIDQAFSTILPYMKNGFFKNAVFKTLPVVKPDMKLAGKIIDRIDYDISTNFAAFEGLDKKIDSNYLLTKKFIEQIP
ncbi:MAG: polysaccharide pyruvyl transferase family protein [Bacteroidia bacterium]|nr:polysaccharide pyruvyl transferase family protein [Bacteroidia bacterium]